MGMTETNLVDQDWKLHETFQMYSPKISKTGSITEAENGRFLSRSLPVIMKNVSQHPRQDRDDMSGKIVSFRNRDRGWESKQLESRLSSLDSHYKTDHLDATIDSSNPRTLPNGKGLESKVVSERAGGLYEGSLSISTLSLSSSNEANFTIEDDDHVEERFWKLLTDDGDAIRDSLSVRNGENGYHDEDKDQKDEIKKHHSYKNMFSTAKTGGILGFDMDRSPTNHKDASNCSQKSKGNSVGISVESEKFGSDNSVSLTRVTDISLGWKESSSSDNDSSKEGSCWEMDGMMLGNKYYSTPKYAKRQDKVSDFGSITEVRHLNSELLASEFFKKVMKKRDSRRKAKVWVKWTTVVNRRAKERKRVIFLHWKELHLQMKRESLSLRSLQRKEMKQNYYEWKLPFDEEQRQDIALFHFKLSILSRCLQLWKVYIAERRVKAKMNKVARLHFQFHSTKKLFMKWRNSVGRSSVATRSVNKSLLLRVFKGWRKWTQYSKVLHKRHLSSCKEYRNRTLMRATFDEWRYQKNMKLSLRHRIISMQRRAFTLWQLKHQRILLRRRISVVHSNLILQRKCFVAWKEFLHVEVSRREMFIKIVNRMQLRDVFTSWKCFTRKSLCIKESHSLVMAARSNKTLHKAFCKWKQRINVIRFKEKLAHERTSRNISNAAMKWRSQVIEKKLNQKLLAASPFLEFLRLKRFFKRWLREKHKVDREKQRSKVIASLINRGCMARVFTEWRIVTQEDGTIRHMASRIQRRDLARSFDGWRLVVTRKKVAIHYRRIKELEKIGAMIKKWRNNLSSKVKERELKKSSKRNLLARVITVWKEYARDTAQRRRIFTMKYFNIWQKNTASRIEARERRDASLANRKIVLKTRFRLWALRHDVFRRKRIEDEAKADRYDEWVFKMASLKRWRRQFHIHCIVCEYNEDKRFNCLDNAFRQWKEFVQQQLQDAVGRFTDRLERESPRNMRNHTLSESYSSVDIPLLRSSSGFFGSLPNIAKMSSPLPVSPLAAERPFTGRDSPASISPVYPYDRSPRSILLERSYTFSSPAANEERASSFERSRSLIGDRPKSPYSLQSSGSLSNRTKSPFIVPPLFTNGYKTDDEEYTELARPKSLPPFEPQYKEDSLHQREKSTDDESPSSVYGHNFDEDATSCYSFRSGSNGMNREHFISGTIRHWRHLPLSKTFRAWYKYTQDKKLRMELFNHFISSKNAWTLRTIFLVWHRKLYCRLASEKFARVKLLKRYFKGIFNNVAQQKFKREQNLVAQLHLKNSRLFSIFKLWREKVAAKKRLHSLVGRWQEAVHISEGDKIKSEKMLKKVEHQMLKYAFNRWKSMSEKVVVAKEFSDILLTKRVLSLWRRYVVKKKILKSYFDRITLMRSRKVFSRWKKSYYSEKQMQDHRKQVQFLKFKSSFFSWLEWTRETKRLSSQAIKFQKRANLKLVAKAFFVWSEEASRLRVADDHYKEIILIRIVDSWHEYTERKLDLAVRLQDYGTSSIRTKVRSAFDWWKRSAICSGVFKEKQRLQTEILVTNCFLQWKKGVQKIKSERHLRHRILMRTFLRWSRRCIMLNKQRRLVANAAKKWLLKTRANRSLEERCSIYKISKEKILKEKIFYEWQYAAEHSRMARAHFETSLVHKMLSFWHEMTVRKHLLRKNQDSIEGIVEFNLVSSAFYTWKDQYRRRRKYETVLENYLELKQQEMLMLCLANFRNNALKARSEKYRKNRMHRMVWDQWRDAMYQRNTLAAIRKRLTQRLALKYGRKWRKATKDLIALDMVADQQRMKWESVAIKERFHIWSLKTRARSLAKLCFESHLLKSTFTQWKRTTKMNLSRKAMLNQFKRRRDLTELKRLFQKWNNLRMKLQNEKKIEEANEQVAKSHFRKSLVGKCFHGWRNECRIDKICRKRDMKVCAEYFRIWKNECLGENRAEKMYHQNLTEKAWKKWRRSKIKKDVMNAMGFHENRKQLSEVFSAWCNYTYIQRHALKDFQTIKLKTAFRKWMQEFNKS